MGVIADQLGDLIDQIAASIKKDEERIAHVNRLIRETEEALAACQLELEQDLL